MLIHTSARLSNIGFYWTTKRVMHDIMNLVKSIIDHRDNSRATLVFFFSWFKGVDILAGVEAVISHLVVKEFRIPCAHAPALSPPPLCLSLSPKSAAEEVGDL